MFFVSFQHLPGSSVKQWRREGVKAGGGDRSKWEKGRKCLLQWISITFFGKFSIFCPNFQTRYRLKTFFLFYSPSWFFRRSGGFPVNFCPRVGENDLLHFRKKTPKWEKIHSKFSKAGRFTAPRSRRHRF